MAILATTLSFSIFARPVFAAEASPKPFRAVWVSTIYNLDYPTGGATSPAQLKSQADAILDNCLQMGMTAVVLQVRPSGDALYPSEIYPWSQYLTGAQGVAPADGFDPLQYWVDGAHKRGMELHAWINPYRVTRSGSADYNSLASDNPAKLHPEWAVRFSDGNYYLNPGIPEVRQLVIDGAVELAKNYDIDGLHMDDYFYPGTGFDDAAAFAQYGGGFSDIGDWRRDNVNQLVKGLDTALHQAKPGISFGISPFGIWANKKNLAGGSDTNGNQTYFSHYADTRKWVKEGWVDYICPQVYWEIGHSQADYKTLVNWWADVVQGTGVKLYIGMADYKAGNSNASSPWHGISAIKDQIALNAGIPQVDGEMHFRYQFLLTVPGLKEFYTDYNAKGQKPSLPETPDQPSQPGSPDTPAFPENPGPGDNSNAIVRQYGSKDGQGDWILYQNGRWTFSSPSIPTSGWQKIDNAWYYFDPATSLMETGWLLNKNNWYYLSPSSGAMATGWRLVDGKWYYLRDWGGMAKGWLKLGDTWYWLTGSGAMKTGWEKVNGKWYYFYSSGAMAANTKTPDGYLVDASGAMVES